MNVKVGIGDFSNWQTGVDILWTRIEVVSVWWQASAEKCGLHKGVHRWVNKSSSLALPLHIFRGAMTAVASRRCLSGESLVQGKLLTELIVIKWQHDRFWLDYICAVVSFSARYALRKFSGGGGGGGGGVQRENNMTVPVAVSFQVNGGREIGRSYRKNRKKVQ